MSMPHHWLGAVGRGLSLIGVRRALSRVVALTVRPWTLISR